MFSTKKVTRRMWILSCNSMLSTRWIFWRWVFPGKKNVGLIFKTMMQGQTSGISLSLLNNQVLSEIEPEYLFSVFDKLKEFGANAIGASACRSQFLMVQADDPSAYQPPVRSSLSRNLSFLFLLTDGRTARPGLKLRASGD